MVYEDSGEQNDEPQYEPESEYTSASNSDEAEPASSGSETESDDRASEMEAEMQEEEAMEQVNVVRTRKGKRVLVDSSDEDTSSGLRKLPPKRATHTSERVRLQEERLLKEEEDMKMAMEMSLVEYGPPQVTQSLFGDTESKGDETDDDCVIVNEIEGLLTGNWVAQFVHDVWQREKRLLFNTNIEKRGHHLPVKPVKCTRTQAPARTRPIQGDGNCLFRCLSYAVWRTEQQHELIRTYIVKHYPSVWEHPQVQRSSRLWFLKKKQARRSSYTYPNIPTFYCRVSVYIKNGRNVYLWWEH